MTGCGCMQILKLFHPNLGQSDSLTGGQFFAALRLVVHVEGGEGVDRSLAFIQGVYYVSYPPVEMAWLLCSRTVLIDAYHSSP